MYKKFVTVFVLVVTAVALMAIPAEAQDENIQKVKAALKRGQYQTALGLADKIVNEYPDWVWSYMFLGRAQLGLKQYSKAARSFTRGLDYAENDDQRFELKFRCAEAYFKGGEYDDALNQLKSAERHRNSSIYKKAMGPMLMMKGYSNFNLGNYSEAIASFKPIVDSGKASADVLRAVAKSHQEMGNDAKAIELISEVVKKDPKDLPAHKILVKSHINNKNWSKTITAADAALQHFSRDAELYHLKGEALFKQHKYDSALVVLKESLAISPNPEVQYLIGQSYMKKGEYYQATDYFNRAQSGYADDANFFLNYAYCWIQWVPENTEDYKGKKEETSYRTALNNATTLLQQSRQLGGDSNLISGYMEVANQKLERLEMGATYTEEYEIYIDPETGEIVKKKIGGEEN